MKYGKKYLETLQAPGIPEEWRQQAIEYRQLKKVINRVASELKELGLTSEVLKDLLSENAAVRAGTSLDQNVNGKEPRASTTNGSTLHSHNGIRRRRSSNESHASSTPSLVPSEDGKLQAAARIEQVVKEDEQAWESSEDSSEDLSEKRRGKRKAKSKMRRARASYELAGDSANPEPRIHIVFSSASSGSVTESSDDDSFSAHVRRKRACDSSQERSTDSSAPSYGDSHRFTELPNSSEDDSSPLAANDQDSSEEVSSASYKARGDDILFEGAGPQANALLKKMYGVGPSSDIEEDDGGHDWSKIGVDVEPLITRRKSDDTLRREEINGSGTATLDQAPGTPTQTKRESLRETADLKRETEAGEADDEAEPVKGRRRRHIHRQHRKEVFIPLNKDNEFLTLLAKALASLAALQIAQKHQFTTAVELLSREVSKVASPNRPKSDLYIWREIFALWVEAQIFESARERDRGERSVDEVETKLSWFVDQVAKRKLAKRMKHKDSRGALDKFIQLNVELLDMKKFQLANEEAARKILKKHDKRTALTASLGFPKFIAAATDLSASPISFNDPGSSRVLTLPGFPSLPHVLLSTFTTTLLPVIPQLDDYECAICGEVAFKPIKLECGHKFCVRCLVKMQKRGQDACPQCRSPVVLRANAANLDTALQSYLQLWFPREVKAKEKSNRREAAKEEIEEMGLTDHKCTVM